MIPQSVNNSTNPITFVGAGPGDPELITVKGQKALQQADLVVYAGSLVPEAVLTWAPPTAERISSADLHLAEIIDLMTDSQRTGKHVVRLHTGDPSLYGAIFEQMAELDKRSVPYCVIPGVTAAFAAAATMGIEYTLPEISQTLILTRMAGRTPVPEAESLASLAAHRTSMVIYLSVKMADRVAAVLTDAYGPDAPCALAYRVSHPDERVVRTTVSQLPEVVQQENITRQALIIVGEALGVSLDRLVYKSKLYDKNFEHGFRKP